VLEEISPEGATLLTECPARKGSRVNFDGSACELHGKVVQCHRTEGGYITEVNFAAKEEWSMQRFKPERSFDPQTLTCGDPLCGPECGGECMDSRLDEKASAVKMRAARLG
jgi:radical SAM protein with 4Fe4S-binding SPASM domain